MKADKVLVSWVGRENDPFNKPRKPSDEQTPGPTLTLLFDARSEFLGTVGHAVFFCRAAGDKRDEDALNATTEEIKRREPTIEVSHVPWDGADPTDHRSIFEFLRLQLPRLRDQFRGRELVLHASPGTPAMHTLMVIMAETGYVEPPYRLVKSYRPEDRIGRPPIGRIELDIESHYQVFRKARAAAARRDDVPGPDPSKLRSPRMTALYEDARRAARFDVPVLILGERGTGKSTLASWIRSNSPFRKRELDQEPISVACGQYTPETMRSELFGHVKGSFTGASADHKGLLAAANGDTLFLDEIGDISHDVQRLLIKAIEERRFQRFGETRYVASKFRLVTATNRTLPELASRIAPDFFDRISHFRLTVPPLRDVPEELAAFWMQAWRSVCERASEPPTLLTAAAHKSITTKLQAHPLPGNWRDLQRLAWHLVAFRSDPVAALDPSAAIDRAFAEIAPPAAQARPVNGAIAKAFATGQSLDLALPAELTAVATKPFIVDLQAWLADQLPRFAKAREVGLEEACDVTERTLRDWRKKASAETEA